MKATITFESDNADKLHLLIRVAQEMGLAVTKDNMAEDFSMLSRPGAALSTEALEKLAEEMETDDDVLDENASKLYLHELKEAWKKVTP